MHLIEKGIHSVCIYILYICALDGLLNSTSSCCWWLNLWKWCLRLHSILIPLDDDDEDKDEDQYDDCDDDDDGDDDDDDDGCYSR